MRREFHSEALSYISSEIKDHKVREQLQLLEQGYLQAPDGYRPEFSVTWPGFGPLP
jgi:hypothetical protein